MITSNQSISFGKVFCMFFCSVPLCDAAFCYLLLKLSLKVGNLYLLLVLPALERGEGQHSLPWLFGKKTFEKFMCTYKGQGKDRVRMLVLFAPE